MHRPTTIAACAALALAGLGTAALVGNTGATRVREAGEAVLPQRLSETGLYGADGALGPQNRPFVPQYPLWTDGAEKSRWVRLPEGEAVDVSDLGAWRFPVGTTFWKEFAWGGRKVETRMLRHATPGEWQFATYVWNEEQTDALLAPAEGVPAACEVAPQKRHSIPAVADCRTCHASAPSVVLGFDALQLSEDRDPLAPHAEPLVPGALTLRTLVEEGRLSPPRPDLVQRPPRIRASDPIARAAMGYLSANCGACHNDRGPLARLGFALRHDPAAAPDAPEPALATALGAPSRFVCPDAPPESSRIVAPGAPQHSSLLQRMQSRRAAAQMPPLGTVICDAEAVALVRRWIESLAPPAPASAAGAPCTPDWTGTSSVSVSPIGSANERLRGGRTIE